MSKRMFYTKVNHIPVFGVIIRDGGLEPLMDFYNPRTKLRNHETVVSRQRKTELGLSLVPSLTIV